MSNPSFLSIIDSTLRLIALSSTTSTRFPEKSHPFEAPSSVGVIFWLKLGGSANSRAKLDPSPGEEVILHDPFKRSKRRLQMAKPKPVPPNRRLMLASCCSNEPPIFAKKSRLIPIPLSLTTIRNVTLSSEDSFMLTLRLTNPSSVNLMALESRLLTI